MDLTTVIWHSGEIIFAVAHIGFIQHTRRTADTTECDLLLLSCRLGSKSGTEEGVSPRPVWQQYFGNYRALGQHGSNSDSRPVGVLAVCVMVRELLVHLCQVG